MEIGRPPFSPETLICVSAGLASLRLYFYETEFRVFAYTMKKLVTFGIPNATFLRFTRSRVFWGSKITKFEEQYRKFVEIGLSR